MHDQPLRIGQVVAPAAPVSQPMLHVMGVVVDASPLYDPHTVTVLWEPIIYGRRTMHAPGELQQVKEVAL